MLILQWISCYGAQIKRVVRGTRQEGQNNDLDKEHRSELSHAITRSFAGKVVRLLYFVREERDQEAMASKGFTVMHRERVCRDANCPSDSEVRSGRM